MPVGAEPESVRFARLLASAPEAVFDDMRRHAEARSRFSLSGGDEELELALAQRQEHLIDLALAQFGTSKAVVAPLLAEGLATASSSSDAVRRRGLRVACYANEHLALFRSQGLLNELATESTKARILAKADTGELAVLLRNPRVGDDALADLYRKAGPFEKLTDERWCQLVELAADNPRIVADEDNEHGPDWGFWQIHKALFELVTTAPVTDIWCRALHRTLARVHPPGVEIKFPINETLEKWSTFEAKGYDGQPAAGMYTDLPFAEEFRCIVAAVYGTRSVDSGYERAGAPNSKTLPERCAYYGGAPLTKKEVARFAARDGAAFGLAFSFNELAMNSEESREAFEKHMTFWPSTYRSRLEVLARKWTYLRTVIARWDDGGDEAEDSVSASVARLEKDVAAIAKEVRHQWWLTLVGFVLLSWLIGR
jgi:hypothetical protein